MISNIVITRGLRGVVTTGQGRRVVPRGQGGRAKGSRGLCRRERKESCAGGGGDFIILVCRNDRPGLWGCAGSQEGCALKKITIDHAPTCDCNIILL